MKIKFVCQRFSTSGVNQFGELCVEADGVDLFGYVDEKEIMPQLDMSSVVDWMTEQGYTVITSQDQRYDR